MNKIKLSDLIEAIEFHSDEHHSFIDLKNNQMCFFSDSALSCAEDNDDNYPDWQEEEIQAAKRYLDDDSHFLALPSQYDVNEYGMMEDFAYTLDNEHQKESLLIALQGKGAFRRFKDMAIHLGLEKEWYHFRDEQYKRFVLDWCKSENIKVDI